MSGRSAILARGGWKGWVAVLAIASAWAVLHGVYYDRFIPHDSWVHNFPVVYAEVRSSACGSLAYWIWSPDTGVPTLIYALSFSLTQPLRILYQGVAACTQPGPYAAMMLYKAQIYAMYLVFGLGMLTMGRALFQRFASAAYLFAATLFAGLCLDAAHSDQVVIMVFWFPWAAACWVCADRHAEDRGGGWWVLAAVLLGSLQLLDQYPHFTAVAVALALPLYAVVRPRQARLLARQKTVWAGGAVLLLVVAVQLGIVQAEILSYAPSLRASVMVRPSEFGETGFVQPSALFGMLFPLTFQAAFSTIRPGHFAPFIFELDLLVFYIGTLPLLFAVAALTARKNRPTMVAWLVFSVAMLLVASQFSKLYLMLFHVPFFNVFRSYFLYVVYAVFGALTLGGYGLDAILTAKTAERRCLIDRTLKMGGILFGGGAVVFVVFIVVGKGVGPKALGFGEEMARDALIIGGSFFALVALSRWPGQASLAAAFVVTLATQALYTAGAYGIVGITSRAMFARYHMPAALLTPWSAAEIANPETLRRVPCPTFGSCYLGLRDAVSLRRDLDGTFLRHKNNPMFRADLSEADKRNMLGLDYPFLRILPSSGRQEDGRLADLERSVDRMEMTVVSHGRSGVDLGVTPHPAWSAFLDGKRIPLSHSQGGYLHVDVPDGGGRLVLGFEHWKSRIFFWSRWLTGLLGMLCMGWIACGKSRCQQKE